MSERWTHVLPTPLSLWRGKSPVEHLLSVVLNWATLWSMVSQDLQCHKLPMLSFAFSSPQTSRLCMGTYSQVRHTPFPSRPSKEWECWAHIPLFSFLPKGEATSHADLCQVATGAITGKENRPLSISMQVIIALYLPMVL